MYAVIFRTYIKPGRESEFRAAWNVTARYYIEQRGEIGACLHRTDDGMWVAYSRWPDKETRDASWPGEGAPSSVLPPQIRQAILTIKDCFNPDKKLPEICMEVTDDRLVTKPYTYT
jgi:Antibiotic biosynthesis monooxygenase